MTRPPFPEVHLSTWTITRPNTAPGMFAERCAQSSSLLEFPDYGGGDMSTEQRRDALRAAINLHQPTTALAIFLSVVALEDFVRDFGARCADEPWLIAHFPGIEKLRMRPVAPRSEKPFARLDRDPAPLVDFIEVNKLYADVFGTSPYPAECLETLYDLALIRHTVAHHGAIVRPIDAARFQHWAVRPNLRINPPRDIVLAITRFVYQVGRAYELTLRNAVFERALATFSRGCLTQPPPEFLSLLELFNYFGNILPAEGTLPLPTDSDCESKRRALEVQYRDRLTNLCLTELAQAFPFDVPLPAAV